MALYFLALAVLPLAVDWNDGRPYEPVKIQLFLLLTAIALAAMAVSFVLKSMSFPRKRESMDPRSVPGMTQVNSLDLAVTAFFAALALGTITSAYPALSFFGSEERRMGLVFFTVLFALYWLSRLYLKRDVLRLFLKFSTVAVLAVSAYAIAQWFGFDRVDLRLVFKLYGHSGPTRVFSTLGHPNFLGLWLVMLLPLLVWLFARERSRFRYLIFGALTLGTVALVLTYSRAAWFALVAEIAFLLLFSASGWLRTRLRPLAVITLICFVTVFVIPGTLRNRLAASFDVSGGSSLSRLEEWKYGAGLLTVRWLTGYGPETYMWYSAFRLKLAGEHNLDEAKPDPSIADRLHNIWLDTLWNGGVLALMTLAAVLITFALRLRERLRTPNADRGLVTALGVSMLGWLVALQFGFDFSQSAILWWLWLGAAASDQVI